MNSGRQTLQDMNTCEIIRSDSIPEPPRWVPEDHAIAAHFGKSVIYSRYKVQLAKLLSALLPSVGPLSILDVGAGDGLLGAFFQKYRPETNVTGIETFVRTANPPIPLLEYDGADLPFESASWDVVLFSNVLHHTANHEKLLMAAAGVSRRQILIKDHLYRSAIGRAKLAFLDLCGNYRFGVATTFHYLRPNQWQQLFARAGLNTVYQYNSQPFREGLLAFLFENDLEVVFDIHLENR